MPMRLNILVLSLLCAISARAKNAPPPVAYGRSLAAYRAGIFPAALEQASQSIREFPRFYPAYALRARLELNFGSHEQAVKDSNFILSKLGRSPRSRDIDNLFAQGTALLIGGQPALAGRAFEDILHIDSGAAMGLSGLAEVYVDFGDYKSALDAESRLAAVLGGPYPAYDLERAAIESGYGLYPQALSDIISVLRVNPKFVQAYALLAEVLQKKGDFKRAREAYKKTLELDPHNEDALLGLAVLNSLQGRQNDAFSGFAAAAKLDPDGFAPHWKRAQAFWEAGSLTDALSQYSAAIAASDFPPQKALLAARRLISLRDGAAAVKACGIAYSFYAGNAGFQALALVEEAKARESIGQLRRALRASKKAIRIDKSFAQAWERKAEIESKLGKDKKAQSDFDRALALAPKDQRIILSRGEFLYRSGNAQAALADFNAAVAIDSGMARAYNDRGVLYSSSMGNVSLASKDFETAVLLEPKNPEFYFNAGLLDIKERLFSNAIEALNLALSLGGPRAIVLERRAQAYAFLGDQTDAVNDIHAVLGDNPGDSTAYAALGWMYLRAGDDDEAVDALERALGLDPKNLDALLGIAEVHAAQGSVKRARREAAGAARANPFSAPAAQTACDLERKAGDLESSLTNCNRAIELKPYQAEAYLQRALTEIGLGLAEKALTDLKRASRLGCGRPQLFLAQAAAQTAMKRYQDAQESYEKARAIDPDVHRLEIGFTPALLTTEGFYNALDAAGLFKNPDVVHPYAFVLRGDALYNAEHYDAAIDEFSKAVEVSSGLADAYIGRALCLEAEGRSNEALQDLNAALGASPMDPMLHNEMAKFLAAQGRYPEAIKEEIQANRINPKDAEVYLEAGNIRYFMKDYPKALANYQLAVKFDPTNPRNQDGMGMGFFALGRYPDAIQSFSTGAALEPDKAGFYKNRGAAYADMKNYADAVANFRTAAAYNTDPAAVKDYNRLIEGSKSRLAQDKP
ncbi:MAG: tetratricopeptide repeat protein [Elusimicrobiota bacterium]